MVRTQFSVCAVQYCSVAEIKVNAECCSGTVEFVDNNSSGGGDDDEKTVVAPFQFNRLLMFGAAAAV